MGTTYKIAYEHYDDSQTRAEEVFVESEDELTANSDEVNEAVKRDLARLHTGKTTESFSILSVVPFP